MEDKFEIFAIVNLFGHQRLAGKVTLQTLGNVTMIRVDVPETTRIPAFTRYINPTAIYSMDPVTEELMKSRAEAFHEQPISVYDIQEVIRRMKPALQESQNLSDDDNDDKF